MGKYYVTEMLEVLMRAGCQVEENEITDGWWERSRSSGGFDDEPLGVVWHHTASSTSPNNDLDYMINGSPDRPVGNVLLGRDGIYRPVAAGCANTQGKGGPVSFSRGVCPLDQGNTKLFAFEIANNGVGEAWPQVQIDAAFLGSNALNAHWHNRPDDVVTHALGSGDGYTSRKIDPATAAAVQGPWRPASSNSSGTWLLEDLRAECRRRAGSVTPPNPIPIPGKPGKEHTMWTMYLNRHGFPGLVNHTVSADGIRWHRSDLTASLDRLAGVAEITIDKDQMLSLLVDRRGVGPCPYDGSVEGYEDPELTDAWKA